MRYTSYSKCGLYSTTVTIDPYAFAEAAKAAKKAGLAKAAREYAEHCISLGEGRETAILAARLKIKDKAFKAGVSDAFRPRLAEVGEIIEREINYAYDVIEAAAA